MLPPIRRNGLAGKDDLVHRGLTAKPDARPPLPLERAARRRVRHRVAWAMTHSTPDWFHPAWAATVRGSAEAISRSAGEIAMHGPPATPLPLDVSTRQAPPHTDPVALPLMWTMSVALGARAPAVNGILVTLSTPG